MSLTQISLVTVDPIAAIPPLTGSLSRSGFLTGRPGQNENEFFIPLSGQPTPAFGGWSVQVDWSSLQVSQGAAISGAHDFTPAYYLATGQFLEPGSRWNNPANNAIDNAIAQCRYINTTYGTNAGIRIRVGRASRAPAWLQALTPSTWTPIGVTKNTFTMYDTLGSVSGEVSKWWTPAYLAAYTDLQNKLAAIYDLVPEVGEVNASMTGTVWDEFCLRQTNDPTTRINLLNNGFTFALDDVAQKAQFTALAVWKQTRIQMSFNAYQRSDPAFGTSVGLMNTDLNSGTTYTSITLANLLFNLKAGDTITFTEAGAQFSASVVSNVSAAANAVVPLQDNAITPSGQFSPTATFHAASATIVRSTQWTDEAYTDSLMAYARGVLGPRAVLFNESVRFPIAGPGSLAAELSGPNLTPTPTAVNGYQGAGMYPNQRAMGPPIGYQTANNPAVTNLTTTTTAIASGATGVASLSVGPIPRALVVGDVLTITDPTNTNSQMVTLTVAAAIGATSLTVASFTALFAFGVGSAIVANVTDLQNTLAWCVGNGAMNVEPPTNNSIAAYNWPVPSQAGFTSALAVVGGSPIAAHTVGVTTITVSPLPQDIASGDSVRLVAAGGGAHQDVVASVHCGSGTTTLSLVPFTNNFQIGNTTKVIGAGWIMPPSFFAGWNAQLATNASRAAPSVSYVGTWSTPVSDSPGYAIAGSTGYLADAGHAHARSQWTPVDNGLVAWSFDPVCISGNTAPTAGTLYMSKVHVQPSASGGPQTVTKIGAAIAVVGVNGGASLANCYLGIYTAGGVLLASTADLSASWSTGTTGGKSFALATDGAGAALTSIVLAPGDYYVGLLVGVQSTTAVAFARATNISGNPWNFNMGGAVRFANIVESSTTLTLIGTVAVTAGPNALALFVALL